MQEGLTLAEFDSLPATAGLSNIEALELSLKHALALLPRMVMVRDAAIQAESPDHFSLR